MNHSFIKTALKPVVAILLPLLLNSPAEAQEHSKETHTSCGDFDLYINSKWKDENPVPSTESRWGSFNVLSKSIEEKTETLIEGLLEKKYPDNSYQQQIGDLYRSLLDTAARNQRGLAPIQNYFKMIDNAQSFNDLVVLNAIIPGFALPIDGGVSEDLMNSKMNTFYISQAGLSLGDRDYYLSDDPDQAKIREELKNYMSNVEKLLGKKSKKANKIAKQIYAIEKDVAHYHLAKEDMRDPFKIYNKYTLDEVKKAAPSIDWDEYFRALHIQPKEIIVINTEILKNYQKIIKNHSLNAWKEYSKYHFVKNMSAYLPDEFEKESFNFYSTVLSGVKEQLPLNERSIRRVNSLLGEPIGRLFVDKYFSPTSKHRVEHMIENMRSVYEERINGLEWMSDLTKKEALHKLSTFTYKIGYPNKWTNYSTIDIESDKLFENVMNISSFEIQKELKEYGKETDTEKWEMNAHEVNAYYNPLFNEIVFPAGILQPPFFNPEADDALNYGGIGGVIGHEFSHGFDDQGSQFDADGNLKNWWTDEDRKKFDELTSKLADQYSNYEILPNVKVNGKFTLGENIADQGGVVLSYYALLKEFENKEEPALIDGMNYKQRFFLGWATVWRNNSTNESIKQLITLDPHAPAKARINVTLSNLKEFYDAFDCDTPEVKEEDRVIIW
ncbi:MAG TPA: M13 family metallopeptidase [Chitinophagales bacterium]|nr:M13 family metallopeptidase [Chitinophagales bacterium]